MLNAFCALIFLPWLAHAEFTVPPLTGPVVDRAAMLSDSTRESMDRFLRRLKDSGGTQLQVLTVPDLGGLSIEEASIRVVDQWKLGTAKGDNGVLLMVAAAEKRVRIEVGQGHEGSLTDAASGRIIRDVILPEFRRGDPNRALTKGVFAILHYTDPKFLDRDGSAPSASEGGLKIGVDIIIFLLFAFTFVGLPLLASRRRRGIWRGPGGGYSGGSWGGGSWGGGGGFGGGGGGSWGGGGGGFSGGGASGGW